MRMNEEIRVKENQHAARGKGQLKLTAVNDFHGRECTVIAKGGKKWYINRRQYQRFWKMVCGVSGCKCSTRLFAADGREYECFSPNGLANPDFYEIDLIVLP